ncbi:monooxygenase [Vibrio sp. VB16]|uniref:monooxygenase n=1 Tax=Vibrio sp. VB16 TaxID=2785746 RepID=UPI0018A0E395|nr:monooxygenase [Vibrio sp. VB16]UGA55694.1 monooxygenase [Vibrio sp. VB16]
MRKLLQVDFSHIGPFAEDMTKAMTNLAESINQEPGMIWKIWTESEKSQLGGGIYLFENETLAKNYMEMHSNRLEKMGVTDIRGIIFDVNESLTYINNGPTN